VQFADDAPGHRVGAEKNAARERSLDGDTCAAAVVDEDGSVLELQMLTHCCGRRLVS